MSKRLVALILLMAFSGELAHAVVKSFTPYGRPIKVNVPNGWQAKENVIGLPLVVVSPNIKGRASVISIVPMGFLTKRFEPKDSSQTAGFQKSKKLWLSKRNGKALAFYPYKYKSWKNMNAEAYVVGYKFMIDKQVFEEKTYYLRCNNYLYNVVTYHPVVHGRSIASELDKTVETLQCPLPVASSGGKR